MSNSVSDIFWVAIFRLNEELLPNPDSVIGFAATFVLLVTVVFVPRSYKIQNPCLLSSVSLGNVKVTLLDVCSVLLDDTFENTTVSSSDEMISLILKLVKFSKSVGPIFDL